MDRVGEYEVQQELGRGATARIFRARHAGTGDTVSLKVFHPHLLDGPRFLKRVERELDATSRLDHELIVRVHGLIENPRALVMDYVDGESLETFQARLPYVLPEVSVLILIEILKALEYAHSKGLIHRDLKPENILIAKDGRVLVTDFGLARATDSTLITRTNEVLGSVDYMSPEQTHGDPLSAASDLFSAGSILYFLFTGTRPFRRSAMTATLQAIQNEEPESARARNPKLSAELTIILKRAMAKDLSIRFSTARDFRIALESYLASIGLDADWVTFKLWLEEPSTTTVEALNTAAETLAVTGERALKERRWNSFLEAIAHLSLKAPETPALERLLTQYRRRKGQVRRRWAALAFTLLMAGAVPFARDLRKGESLPVSAPAPISSPVVMAPSVASSPVVLGPPAEKFGTVIFKVERSMKVFWDGRVVDPSQPLKQPTGDHWLLIESPGYSTLRAKVRVKKGHPTIVNARR
jgi:serine/threonine protein kinase